MQTAPPRSYLNWLVALGAFALALMSYFAADDTSRRLLVNSAVLALASTCLALPPGILLAVILTRSRVFGRRMAVACLGLLLLLPLYVQLSAWDAAIGKLGWYSLAYGSVAEPWLDGMRAAVFIHGVAAIPWVALIVGVGLASVDARQEEAALLEASPLVVLLRITLPQCLAFIVAAAVWVVVMTVSEMTVTNIYLIAPGSATYTEELYMSFAGGGDVREAVVQVLPGLLAFMAVLAGTFWFVSRLASRRVLPGHRQQWFISGRGTKFALDALVWLALALLLAVPVSSLLYKAGVNVTLVGGEPSRAWSAAKCLTVIGQTPAEFRDELGWTLIIALAAATLSMLAATLLAWPARRGGWRSFPAIISAVLALAVPGPLVGIAIIYLLNHDIPPRFTLGDGRSMSWLIYLYDKTPLAPILAQAVRGIPLALLIAWHAFASISDDVLSAAQLDGATNWQTFLRIALPQRKWAVLGAWACAFAIAAGDLAWSQLVIPPGMDTVQRRVFGLVHSGVEEQVAGLCLIMIAMYTALTAVVLLTTNAAKDRAPNRV